MKNGKKQLSPPIYLVIGIVIFTISAATIITVNAVTGIAPTLLERSFSRFISAHIWSSLFYLVICLADSYFIIKFLVLSRPAKLYLILGLVIVFFMLMVALFPVGITKNGIVDTVHNITSRSIFISMMIHSFIGLFCYRGNKRYLFVNLAVLAADLTVLVIVLFFPKLFWTYPCLFELILIYFYFGSLLSTVKQTDNSAK